MPTEPLAALSVSVRADLTALLRDIQRAPAEAARALAGQEGAINAELARLLAGGTRESAQAQSQRTAAARQGVRERNALELEAQRQASRLRKLAVGEEQAGQREITRTLGVAQRENFRTEQAASRARVTLMAEEKRQRAAADQAISASTRSRVAAENRQWRDETAFIKSQLAERADASKRAADDEAAAMKRLDGSRRLMRGEPVGTARQQARQVIGGAVTNAAVTVGGAALLGGFEAVKQAGAFQTTMLDLKSNTAVTPANLELYRKAILSFANTYGADMKETAMAFQRAENHFYSGQNAVKVVDAAVKLSTYAGSAPGQTANLLAQQMHSFNIAPSQAMNTAAIIHQAAVRGNLTAEELIQNAGYGINLAGAFSENPATVKGRPVGLDIKDALAMFSALTSHGFNPAEAATQTRNVISRIVGPTPATLKRLDALKAATGVDLTPDFSLQSLQRKGLHGIMADIVAATPGHPEVAMQLMGAQRGGVGAAVLAKDLAGASSDFRFTYGQLSDIQSGKMANPVAAGLPERVGSFDQEVKIFDNRMRTLGQTIGTTLMPPALKLLSWAQRLADALTRFDTATGGKAGAGVVYGGAALGALGLGVKGRNWLRGAAGVGRVAAGAEAGVEAAAAKSGPIERLLTGTATFFARLAGLDLGAGALAILSRLGIVGAAVGGTGYLIKRDYDVYQDTQGLGRRSAASERDLTAGSDTRRRIDGQVVQNRTEAARLADVIRGYKAEIAKIQAEGRRTGADGGPVIAQMTTRMRAMERDREHLLTDANRLAGDARRLSGPQGRLTDAMARHIGEQTGIQCGAAVTKAMHEAGIGGTATARVQAAARDPRLRLRPNAQGQLPPGSVVFFPGKSGLNNIGGDGSEHFGMIGADGRHVNESTTAGGAGRHYRGDRTFAQIAGQHGGQFIAVMPVGAPASTPQAAMGNAGSPQSGDWFSRYTSLTRGGGKEDRKAARIAYANREAQDRLAGDPTDRFSREKAALAAHLDALRHAGVSELTVEATRVQGLKRIHAEELADLQRHVTAKARLHGTHLRAALTQPLADMGGGIKAGLASARGLGSFEFLPQVTEAQEKAALTQPLFDLKAGLKGFLAAGHDIGSSDLLPQITPAQVRTAAQSQKKADALGDSLAHALAQSRLKFDEATGKVDRYQAALTRLGLETKTLTAAQKAQIDQIGKWDEATARVDRMKASIHQAADTMKGSLSNAFEGLLGKSKNPFGQIASDFSRMIRKMLADWAASRITDKVTGLLDGLIGRHAAPGSATGLPGASLPGMPKSGGSGVAGILGVAASLIPGQGGAIAGALGGLLGGTGVAAGVPAGVTPVWVVGASPMGAAGGLGGAAGALGALSGLPGMGAGAGGAMSGIMSVLGGGGAAGGGGLGSLLGGAGGAGAMGAPGAGLSAALPWVAVAETVASLFHGNFFKNLLGGKGGLLGMFTGKKKFLGLFAEGGTLPANSWGIAGERGPEVIHTGSRPLTVVPNGGGAQAPAGPVMNFNIEHVHEASDGASMARMMADVIKHRLRTSYA